MSYTVASVNKALDILEHLAVNGETGVTELADRTQSTKSQVFRLLYTLEQRGFVHKDPLSRRYRLGYRNLYIGDQTKGQLDIVRLSQPLLEELADISGENAHLVTREGYRSVCVALSESSQPLRLYAQVGRRGPLHAGGASKVLLAYAPAEVRNEVLTGDLEIFTPSTITDPQRLENIISEIKKTGLHVSQDDLDAGAFSIGTPVHDHSGEVTAALSVAGPVSRLGPVRRAELSELVKAYGEKISETLGWRRLKGVEAGAVK